MVVPERKNSDDGILQAFSGRKNVLGEALVANIIVGVSFISFFKRRRGDVVTSSPDFNLVFTVLGCSFRLVETLEGSVMSFVESPTSGDGEVQGSHILSSDVVSLDGSGKDGSVDDIEFESLFLQDLSGASSFGLT